MNAEPTERSKHVVRLIRFLVVGGGSLGVQLLALKALRPYLGPTAAFSVSWVVSTAVHYLLNRFWALPSERPDTRRQLAEYFATVVLSYAISTGAFELGRRVIGLGEVWATICAVPPSTLVVFLVLNYRVFPARPSGVTRRNM
jgi:putative flippase GtrA